ncbi:MAG: hypothetical protein NVS4B3_00310 [Gemmatimonadaceae bacterium]
MVRKATWLRPGVLIFVLPAMAVVMISLIVTLRNGTGAEPARFSGSSVVQRMPSILPSSRLPTPLHVTIVRDDAAASFYGSGATLDTIIERWRDLLATAGAEVRIVRPAALAAERTARVLIIPSSPCLTLATREAIDAAGARHYGLILTGVAGTHDAGCRPIGFGLVVSLTGASRAEPLEPRGMVYVTVPASGALGADIPPGARLEIRPGSQVALRHAARDAIYCDYALRPLPVTGSTLLDGAISHAVIGQSRSVYWGFELHDVVDRPWNRAILALLVRNSVAWAAGVPLADVEPWPAGRTSAVVLAQDVEDQFANVRYALDSLHAAGVQGTFFLTSNLARQNRRLTHQLAEDGEVGTHSENHRLLGGTPAATQRDRLLTTQEDLADLIGRTVHGLRPPQEQFDAATLAGWLAAGGSYLLGANDARAAAPELLGTDHGTIILLGRFSSDDISAVALHGRDVDALTKEFLDEMHVVEELGGLYVLSYHSQLLARPDLVPTVARLARVVATDSSIWHTTAGQVADWWRTRAAVVSRVRMRGGGRFDLVVQNKGPDTLEQAVVDIRLPSASVVARSPVPLLSGPPERIRVVVPVMGPRTTRTFTIELAVRGKTSGLRARHRGPRHAKPARARRWRWLPW